jgi:hypothetical protein
VSSLFINHLLKPSGELKCNNTFDFNSEQIYSLANECFKIIQRQPMVIRVDAPIKVFGDIHG